MVNKFIDAITLKCHDLSKIIRVLGNLKKIKNNTPQRINVCHSPHSMIFIQMLISVFKSNQIQLNKVESAPSNHFANQYQPHHPTNKNKVESVPYKTTLQTSTTITSHRTDQSNQNHQTLTWLLWSDPILDPWTINPNALSSILTNRFWTDPDREPHKEPRTQHGRLLSASTRFSGFGREVITELRSFLNPPSYHTSPLRHRYQ